MRNNFILTIIGLLMWALPSSLIAGETLKRIKSKGLLKVATSPNWHPQFGR